MAIEIVQTEAEKEFRKLCKDIAESCTPSRTRTFWACFLPYLQDGFVHTDLVVSLVNSLNVESKGKEDSLQKRICILKKIYSQITMGRFGGGTEDKETEG